MRVTAIPARHGPAEIERATGEVTGWLLEWGNEPDRTLYISGDTVLFQRLEEVARRFPVNVALLHLGAAQVERFGPVSITLTASEGAHLAALLGDAMIIPIHYEGWTHLKEGREDIEQAFLRAGQSATCVFCRPVSLFSLTPPTSLCPQRDAFLALCPACWFSVADRVELPGRVSNNDKWRGCHVFSHLWDDL